MCWCAVKKLLTHSPLRIKVSGISSLLVSCWSGNASSSSNILSWYTKKSSNMPVVLHNWLIFYSKTGAFCTYELFESQSSFEENKRLIDAQIPWSTNPLEGSTLRRSVPVLERWSAEFLQVCHGLGLLGQCCCWRNVGNAESRGNGHVPLFLRKCQFYI